MINDGMTCSSARAAGMHLASKVCKRGQAKLVVFGWHMVPNTYNLYDWIKGQVILSTHPAFSYHEIEKNLERALWAIKERIFPMEKLITHRFPIQDVGQAFEMARNHEDDYVKGVIIPNLT